MQNKAKITYLKAKNKIMIKAINKIIEKDFSYFDRKSIVRELNLTINAVNYIDFMEEHENKENQWPDL